MYRRIAAVCRGAHATGGRDVEWIAEAEAGKAAAERVLQHAATMPAGPRERACASRRAARRC